jgi:type 1 glutamine amidotransferase
VVDLLTSIATGGGLRTGTVGWRQEVDLLTSIAAGKGVARAKPTLHAGSEMWRNESHSPGRRRVAVLSGKRTVFQFTMKFTTSTALAVALVAAAVVQAAPKRVILVTATKGFRHSSIATAENVITTLGETSGAYTVVDVVRGGPQGNDDAEVSQKLTMDKLKGVDGVIFANTTGDLAIPDKDGFIKWIEEGHGFVGMHSCSDTFHGYRPFIDMLGGEFLTHGAQVSVDMYNQDRSHPAVKHLGPVWTVFDEIYEFKSFERAKVHGLLTLDKHPQNLTPGDYSVAWAKTVGSQNLGKVFYTSLGHREDVWTDALYQQHILGGIQWSLGLADGSGAPTDVTNRLSAEEQADGFKLLFDGTSLKGWKYRREDGKRSWSTQNGMLCNVLAKDEHGTDIQTEETFRDFVVRYDFQVPPGSNSGFYLRGRHEVQIYDDFKSNKAEMGGNGAIYNVKPVSLFASRKAGQWQKAEVRIVGQKITVVLNGVKVHDNVDCPKGTGGQLDDLVDQPGPILLQGDHGSVGFRNIRIKRLN